MTAITVYTSIRIDVPAGKGRQFLTVQWGDREAHAFWASLFEFFLALPRESAGRGSSPDVLLEKGIVDGARRGELARLVAGAPPECFEQNRGFATRRAQLVSDQDPLAVTYFGRGASSFSVRFALAPIRIPFGWLVRRHFLYDAQPAELDTPEGLAEWQACLGVDMFSAGNAREGIELTVSWREGADGGGRYEVDVMDVKRSVSETRRASSLREAIFLVESIAREVSLETWRPGP